MLTWTRPSISSRIREARGSLTVPIGDLPLRYRLPLPGVLPPSLDPKTGESFPGTYHFNPYTGGKLESRPAVAHEEPAPKSP